MTTMDGLAAAVAIGALLVVPTGLRCVATPMRGAAGRLIAAAQVGALPAGVLAAIALLLPVGPLAAGLALPWLAVGAATFGAAVARELAERWRIRPDVRHAESAALAFLAVAPAFLVADRLGLQPLGIDSTTVRLTAIHFTFTGFLLPLVGAFAWRARPSRWLEAGIGSVIVGIPITALGFLGLPLLNWIGAICVATGGTGIALGCIVAANASRSGMSRPLLRIGGLSLLLAMPLALIYASGTFFGQGWLDVATMARVHGTLNGIGFALPVLAAMTLERRAADARSHATVGVDAPATVPTGARR